MYYTIGVCNVLNYMCFTCVIYMYFYTWYADCGTSWLEQPSTGETPWQCHLPENKSKTLGANSSSPIFTPDNHMCKYKMCLVWRHGQICEYRTALHYNAMPLHITVQFFSYLRPGWDNDNQNWMTYHIVSLHQLSPSHLYYNKVKQISGSHSVKMLHLSTFNTTKILHTNFWLPFYENIISVYF